MGNDLYGQDKWVVCMGDKLLRTAPRFLTMSVPV